MHTNDNVEQSLLSFSLSLSTAFFSDNSCQHADGSIAEWVYDEASIPPNYGGEAVICGKDLDKIEGEVDIDVLLNLPPPFSNCDLVMAAVNPFLNQCVTDLPIPDVKIEGSYKLISFVCDDVPTVSNDYCPSDTTTTVIIFASIAVPVVLGIILLFVWRKKKSKEEGEGEGDYKALTDVTI